MSKLESAQRTIAAVREKSDSCIVFCSLGKDSLVTLDMVAPHFDRVVCVFMYFVPHLEHIERWVTWVKARYPKVEFIQVPHWNLSYILRGGLLHTEPESQASKAGGRGKVNPIKDGHQLCVSRHEESRLHEQTVDAQRI